MAENVVKLPIKTKAALFDLFMERLLKQVPTNTLTASLRTDEPPESEIMHIFPRDGDIRVFMTDIFSLYTTEDIRRVLRGYLEPVLAERLGVKKVTIDWNAVT